ncbi:MAG: RNA polymerase sigma-70 factor [Marinifilaceae bacterium]
MPQLVNIKNEKDLEFLFTTYYAALTAFANKYTGDLDVSRELVQEFFIYLFEKREQLQIEQSVKSYLYQAVRNRCLNYLKKQKTEMQQKEDYRNEAYEDRVDFHDEIECVEFEQQIHSLIESLPDACKNIFKMSRFEGIKNDEIAQQLNISKRTVETQISKALKILRTEVKQLNTSQSNRFYLGCLLF